VETAGARFAPGTTIISAGPWLPSLMPGAIGTPLRVLRQTLFWFEPAYAADFTPGPFPIFIWHWGNGAEDVFYGFPDAGSGVKVATEQSIFTTTPAGVDREIAATEANAMFDRHVRYRLPGVCRRLKAAATCLYTSTPDAGFIIGRPPAWPSTIIISACSGHGFKHSAAIGEAVAEMAMTGTTPAVLAPFQEGLVSSAP
jgi:sarcosine oxidase